LALSEKQRAFLALVAETGYALQARKHGPTFRALSRRGLFERGGSGWRLTAKGREAMGMAETKCANCGDPIRDGEGVSAIDPDGEVAQVCDSQCRIELEDE